MRPMLAATLKNIDEIIYPVFASPKLDGVRAIIQDGKVLSRTLKSIPNHHIQSAFGLQKLNGYDGELIVGSPTAKDCYRKTTSAVMTHSGEPAVVFYVFDFVDPTDNFRDRFLSRLEHLNVIMAGHPEIITLSVNQTLIHNISQLLEIEQICLDKGYEGLMLRDPAALYKFGRSTIREHALLKLKRFSDSEAEVMGVVAMQKNNNPKSKSELGLSRRSSHKANKIATQKIGAFVVRDIHSDVEFEIGTGFVDSERVEYFKNPPIGQIMKYKFFAVGVKDKPRHPVFLGWRDHIDLGAP